MANRIREFRERAGLSQAALGAKVHTGQSQIDRLEKGERRLTVDWLTRIAAALEIEPNDLLSEPAAVGRPDNRQSPPSLPPRTEMPRDVPVLGTAMGANGEGAFELNQTGGVVDMVLRGPGIANSRKVFAIYVEGDSMSPRHEPGELRYCDPSRPPRIGDDVVIVMAAKEPGKPPQAYLKKLVRRSASEIMTRQFNPEKEVRFPTDQVQQVIRVLTTNEVMGV